MDNAVDVLVLHQLIYTFEVTDIHLDKLIVGLVLHVLQVGEVAGVGQFVEVDNLILWVLVDKQTYHVASDESGSAGNDDIHILNVKCLQFITTYIILITKTEMKYCVEEKKEKSIVLNALFFCSP